MQRALRCGEARCVVIKTKMNIMRYVDQDKTTRKGSNHTICISQQHDLLVKPKKDEDQKMERELRNRRSR